jgi:dCTP deaminase
MILGDRDLKYFLAQKRIVVDPLSDNTIHENGMDFRIGNEILRMKETQKVFDASGENNFDDFFEIEKGDSFIIKPYEHVLLVTKEYIKLPDEVIAFANLKSSIARMGLFIPPTIIDAGFEGDITIEVVGSRFPVIVKKDMRFLHLVFARTLTPVENPYKGKYQGQRGVTMPKTHNML